MPTTLDATISSPAALASLVSVQPGSVVSRTLLKNGGGSLTLFAFDRGQGLSEHSTPHDATVLILEGSAQVVIGGTGHVVSAGEALHLPASIPHALEARDPFKMLLVMHRAGA